MGFIDAYDRVKELIDPLRKYSGNEEFLEAIDEVMGYAMDYYVSEAEDMGQAIVANAEVINVKSYDKGVDDASEKAWEILQGLVEWSDEQELLKEAFDKEMQSVKVRPLYEYPEGYVETGIKHVDRFDLV